MSNRVSKTKFFYDFEVQTFLTKITIIIKVIETSIMYMIEDIGKYFLSVFKKDP